MSPISVLFLVTFIITYSATLYLSFKKGIITSNILLISYLILFYSIISYIKPFDFGTDFLNYYHSYTRIHEFGMEYSRGHDVILNVYFYISANMFEIFNLGAGRENFKLVILFWFIVIFSLLYLSVKKEWRCHVLFALLLIFSSRLFWEYSSNTLRSFSSAIILSAVVLTNKHFTKISLLVIAFFIHFKSFILIAMVSSCAFLIAKFLEKRALYIFISALTLIVLSSKLVISGLIDIDGIKGYISTLQENASYKLHSNTINAESILPISLYLQYLIYIVYPVIVVGYLNIGKVVDDQKYRILTIMTCIFTFLFPEVFLVERLGQFILMLSTILFVRYVKKFWLYAPIMILNIYTIYLLFSSSDVL